MKKLVIMAAAIFATVNIFAQGTVNFSNIGGSGGVTNGLTGARVVVGSTFQVQLYYAPDLGNGTPADSALMPLAGVGNIAPTPGIFSAGTRTAPVSPPGTFAYFQVRAWQAALNGTIAASSYEDALTKGLLAGKSNTIRVNTSDPTLVPPEAAASLIAAGLLGFSVSAVPEPSVIGLGLLGAGALLMLRRRK